MNVNPYNLNRCYIKQFSNLVLKSFTSPLIRKTSSEHNVCKKSPCAVILKRDCSAQCVLVGRESSIKNKIALVHGGSQGIGLKCVQELLDCGAKSVMISDCDETKGKQIITGLCKDHGKDNAAFIKRDPMDETMIKNVYKSTIDHFCGLDVVMNHLECVPGVDWNGQIEHNVIGLVHSTLYAYQYMGMHHNGNGGIIINMISTPNSVDNENCPVFIGAKHFIIGFSRAIAARCYKQTCVKILTLCIHDYSGYETLSKNPSDGRKNKYCDNKGDVFDLMSVIENGKNGAVWVSCKS